MNLSDIKLDIFRRLNLSDTPPTRVVNRITTFINQRHRQILSMPGITRLREDSITFTTVPNQAVYALPPSVGRIHGIVNAVEGEVLQECSLSWLRNNYPTPQSGEPTAYAPLGLRAVQNQPSEPSTLHIVSTSVSDLSNASVEVIRSGGYQDVVTVVMTGTTPVQVGGYTDVIGVSNFSLDADAVGTVTLTANGDTLATITTNQNTSRYLGIQLHPTPGAQTVYNVDYTREIQDMVQPGDVPLIPQDYHYLLSIGARLDEYEHLDDERRHELQGQWSIGIKRLLNYIVNTPDYLVVPGANEHRWSSLGGDYPAGS